MRTQRRDQLRKLLHFLRQRNYRLVKNWQDLAVSEWLHFHFSLLCIGEGNGNPLKCSCLENPRDREAWWVAVYGVAQSQTWLKQLSSSSSCSLGLGNDLVCFIYVLCFHHSFSWGSHAFSILLFIPTSIASGDWWKLCWNFLFSFSLF